MTYIVWAEISIGYYQCLPVYSSTTSHMLCIMSVNKLQTDHTSITQPE